MADKGLLKIRKCKKLERYSNQFLHFKILDKWLRLQLIKFDKYNLKLWSNGKFKNCDVSTKLTHDIIWSDRNRLK